MGTKGLFYILEIFSLSLFGWQKKTVKEKAMNSTFLMRGLLVCYLIICGTCLFERNFPKALYWFAAALITSSVLWGMK